MVDELSIASTAPPRPLNLALLELASHFGKAIGETFAVLNRIEYSAPWAVKSTRARSR